ncbi:MAG: hypothetical protein F4W95_04975 [Chloroflexi bacterium]|nr:hypothetical protein [Chloroflexota bacterium]MYD47823.1 hypothetical protein [Chloroflexota bacterium]
MSAIRISGLMLLLAAIATAVSVMTRLSSSLEPFPDSPIQLPIILDTGQYVIAGAARVLSGLALLAAAIFLRLTLNDRQPVAAGISAALLVLSGAVTAISGACMLALAAELPEAAASRVYLYPEAAWGYQVWIDPVNQARWIAGKVGFTLAGLGLIALGPVQWRIGGLLKISAVADVIIEVAMLFIWVDAATVMHRVSGIAFLVWLIVSGVWLAAGLLKTPKGVTQHGNP